MKIIFLYRYIRYLVHSIRHPWSWRCKECLRLTKEASPLTLEMLEEAFHKRGFALKEFKKR